MSENKLGIVSVTLCLLEFAVSYLVERFATPSALNINNLLRILLAVNEAPTTFRDIEN